MARLHKFKGIETLPGVGNPQVVADTAVGAATVELGRQIGSSADKIGVLARKRQVQVNRLERAKAALKLDRDALERLSQERTVNRPGAIGLTEAVLSHLDASAKAGVEGLPEDVKVHLDTDISQTREQVIQRAALIEATENENYYRRGLGEVGDLLVSIVRENPDTIDRAIDQAGDILDSMPLPARDKEFGLRQVREQLVESWLAQLPLTEQIDVLTDLKTVRGKRADPLDPVAGSGELERAEDSNFEGQLKLVGQSTGTSALFQERLQYLQPHTQNRLLARAMKERSVASFEEEDRLSAKITQDPFAISPQDILGNDQLETSQRDRLLFRLEAESSEQEKNLAAVRWLGDANDREQSVAVHQELADRAFTFLDNGNLDRASLARTIYRDRGMLPAAYQKSLSNALNSVDANVLGAALEELSEFHKIDPESVTGSDKDVYFEKSLNKYRVLTERMGLTGKEAAERLARANNSGRRNELLNEFEDQLRRGHIELANSGKLLSAFGKYAT